MASTTHRSAHRSARPVRRSLVLRAYQDIKQGILANRYPPLLQLLEQELAEALGMSRTPVREALIRLENEGLVEIIPRRGVRIVPLSPDDMKEIYQVLTGLEVTAVGLLAERRLAKAELAALEDSAAAMDAALAADDLDAWAEADDRFHRGLLDGCGNRRLAGMAFTLWDQVRRARAVTLRLRPKPSRSTKEHRAVLRAIRRGDVEAARELHRRHRADAGKMLVELLEHHRLGYL